jgi:hypothetical protein
MMNEARLMHDSDNWWPLMAIDDHEWHLMTIDEDFTKHS